MSKQQNIQAYIDTIIGTTITTKSLCLACNCTLPTMLAYIKNNPKRFSKIAHGKYAITLNSDNLNIINHPQG